MCSSDLERDSLQESVSRLEKSLQEERQAGEGRSTWAILHILWTVQERIYCKTECGNAIDTHTHS